jgi:hypothetical protein
LIDSRRVLRDPSRKPDGLLEGWERPEAHRVRDDAPKEKPAEWDPLGGLSVALRRLLRHRDVEAEQVPAVAVLAGGVRELADVGRPHNMSAGEART